MRASAPPNVVGYLLDEARAALAEAGWDDVETAETRPPRRTLLPPYRVLRQRTSGTRVALAVSGERSDRSERSERSVTPAAGGHAADPAARANTTSASDEGARTAADEDART